MDFIFNQQARLGQTSQAALKRRATKGLGCLGDKCNLLKPLAYLPLDLCCVARSQQRLNSELGSSPTALRGAYSSAAAQAQTKRIFTTDPQAA